MPPTNDWERPDKVSTWLVIPYFENDVGRPGVERPLKPEQAVYWLCPSVVADGVPGQNSFKRGEPTSITVDVANWGAGGLTAAAQIRVWWTDPTLTFTKATPFGQAVVLVPAGGTPVRSPEIVGTIPETAPAHICLLIHVAAPQDASAKGSVPDPVGDRHWAQFNLTEVTATSSKTFHIPVVAGNPFDGTMESRFQVEALSDRELVLLSGQLGRRIRTVEPVDVAIRANDRAITGMELMYAGESFRMEVLGRLPGNVQRGESVAIAISQTVAREDGEILLKGGLGVLVRMPDT